jgi:hypothetical protein
VQWSTHPTLTALFNAFLELDEFDIKRSLPGTCPRFADTVHEVLLIGTAQSRFTDA